MLAEPAVRRRLSEQAAAVCGETLATLLLDDPGALLERFLRLLESYWEEAFAEEWRRIEPELADSVTEAGRQIAEHGLYGMLRALWPEVRCDPAAGRFWLERPHDHQVAIGPHEQLALVPSAFV